MKEAIDNIKKEIDELFDSSFSAERKAMSEALDVVGSDDEAKVACAKHALTWAFLYNQRVTVRQINVAAKITDLLG